MHITAIVSIAGHSARIECIHVSLYILQSRLGHDDKANDVNPEDKAVGICVHHPQTLLQMLPDCYVVCTACQHGS